MSVFDLPSYVQHTYPQLIAIQLEVTLGSVLVGLVVALPVGQACVRWPRLYPAVLSVATAAYAIPSIAFFVLLIAYTGLTEKTVLIPLSVYNLVVLIPGVVEGVRAVPPEVRLSADAMGFGPARRYLQVELPLALPEIMAAVRIAVVSSVSLMSVGAVIGNFGGLGDLITNGLREDKKGLIWLGVISLAVLAIVLDAVLLLVQRVLTPWSRGRSSRRRSGRGQATAGRLAALGPAAQPAPAREAVR
ncbi:MAG TPA: ABC transporter permease [Actinocrinis sp.]|nr:ABC transporter permease [Actinocrinis sp.]